MEVIQINKTLFEDCFIHTLNNLKLISLRDGTVNIKLNDQVEVSNFISSLHSQFHYEVCMLKKKLKEM